MTQNVRLQNLRDFTVQIRDANDRIVGTGIAVSTDGKIVTCAHVVEAAGIDPQQREQTLEEVHPLGCWEVLGRASPCQATNWRPHPPSHSPFAAPSLHAVHAPKIPDL